MNNDLLTQMLLSARQNQLPANTNNIGNIFAQRAMSAAMAQTNPMDRLKSMTDPQTSDGQTMGHTGKGGQNMDIGRMISGSGGKSGG